MYYSVGSGYNTSTQACACMYMYVLPNTLHVFQLRISITKTFGLSGVNTFQHSGNTLSCLTFPKTISLQNFIASQVKFMPFNGPSCLQL